MTDKITFEQVKQLLSPDWPERPTNQDVQIYALLSEQGKGRLCPDCLEFHAKKFVRDWVGDRNVVDGIQDCSAFHCVGCGDECEDWECDE